MDKDQKRFLGKILGEIYRIQRSTVGIACPANSAQIYALLNGFEHAIEHELEMIGDVPFQKVKSVMDVLDPIWQDQKLLEQFTGFYAIENALSERGVDRSEAISILRYLKANNQFTDVIAKMDSSGSPTECRRFDLSEWDT